MHANAGAVARESSKSRTPLAPTLQRGSVVVFVHDPELTIVPTLRVGMHFWTLCVLIVALRVTQRFCDVSWMCLRLEAPFRPSASYFDGAKVTKAPSSVSGPTSSGSFALSLTSRPALSVPSR
ncbi:putative membrane protein [Pseudomonas syringae]|nr:putative membrane protein [Pseudomonas syringae]